MHALMFGQSNFFAPRKPTDWWFGTHADQAIRHELAEITLERLVEFRPN